MRLCTIPILIPPNSREFKANVSRVVDIRNIGITSLNEVSYRQNMKNKVCNVNIVTMLKLIVGLVVLILLTKSVFWFYSSTFYYAYFVDVNDIVLSPIYSTYPINKVEILCSALRTGVAGAFYALCIPVIFMFMEGVVYFLKIQKSWKKYFTIAVVLSVILLWNICLAYQTGNRMHEIDIIVGIVETNSTYGLAEMLSDVNVWVTIICGFTIFVIWSMILGMTIKAVRLILK